MDLVSVSSTLVHRLLVEPIYLPQIPNPKGVAEEDRRGANWYEYCCGTYRQYSQYINFKRSFDWW